VVLALAAATALLAAGQSFTTSFGSGAHGSSGARQAWFSLGAVSSQGLSVVAARASSGHEPGADWIDQAAAAVDTSGTLVRAAFRMHRGDPPSILDIDIANRAKSSRSAILQLTRPEGSSVNVKENDRHCQLAQYGTMQPAPRERLDSYLVVVDYAGLCTLRFHVQVGNAEPLGGRELSFTLIEDI